MKGKTHSIESIHYSFVPNHRDVMEALCRTKLSGSEFRAIILILNQTDGYLREEDIIKPQFFEERACLPRSHLCRTLGRLQGWGIISKNRHIYKVLPPSHWSQVVLSPITKSGESQKSPKVESKIAKNGETLAKIGEIQIPSKENILKKTLKKTTPAKKALSRDPRVKTVLDTISGELGTQIPFYAKEGAAVKRALQMGHTEEQILACWRKMKTFPFWRGQWLPLAKVAENIGEFVAGRLTDGKPRDGSGKAQARRAPVRRAEDFRSKQW